MSGKPSEKEKREKRQKLRQVFVSLLFGILILLMVISLIPMGNAFRERQTSHRIRIAEVNREMFDYQQFSVFNYIFGDTKESLNRQYQGLLSDDFLAQYAFGQSVQLLVNYALIFDFCKNVGITPSSEMIRQSLQGRFLGTPPAGLVEYLDFQYANQAVLGNNGDIMNATAPITFGELYSYFDLVNFTATAEAVYVEITNYLIEKVTPMEADEYYIENISTYADHVVINDIVVTNKALSREIIFTAKTNGWNYVIDKYASQISYTPNLMLSNAAGMTKRFNAALTMSADSVYTNSIYENSVYHVIQVVSFPNFESIGSHSQEILKTRYVMDNFASLKQKFIPEIESLLNSAHERLAANPSMRSVANSMGLQYVQTGSISPVNLMLKDSEGQTLNLPVLDNPDCMEFVFTGATDSISRVFTNDSHFMILKVTYRGVNPNMDYASIDDQIAYRYANFKNQANSFDWFANLRTNSTITIYSNDFKDMYQ